MNGEIIKLGINVISSLGVSKVLGDIVKNNTNVVTTADAILVRTGTLVLGTMVVGHASNHVNNTIDSVENMFKKKDEKEDPKDSTEHPIVEG